jgi:hypothetical protein
MEARKLVADYCFPNANEGTNRIELNNGHSLKMVAKLNYKIAAPNDAVDKIEDEAVEAWQRRNVPDRTRYHLDAELQQVGIQEA